MIIEFTEAYFNGNLRIDSKVSGTGKVDIYSWHLSSSSDTLILEISDDPSINPEDLPLVGFACAGWIYEQPISFDKEIILAQLKEGFSLFKANKLNFIPAVSCPCSDF